MKTVKIKEQSGSNAEKFLHKEVHLWDEHKDYVAWRKKQGLFLNEEEIPYLAYSYGYDAALQYVVKTYGLNLDKGKVLKQEN